MAAWMPIVRGMLLAPVIFAYGATLDGQRLDGRVAPPDVDRAMDARLTAYVPVVRASEGARTPEAALRAAEMWRAGRLAGTLLDPMPARYGDGDQGLGARSELVIVAESLSGRLLHLAARSADRERSRRFFAAALEPLRAVQYADAATFADVTGRRATIAAEMRARGFAPEAARATTALLLPEAGRVSDLYRHMARLRDLYRLRFADARSLWEANPAYESVVQSDRREARFLASR